MLLNEEASTCSQTNAAKQPADIVIHFRRFMSGRIGRSHQKRQSGNRFTSNLPPSFRSLRRNTAQDRRPASSTSALFLRNCSSKPPHPDAMTFDLAGEGLTVTPLAPSEACAKGIVERQIQQNKFTGFEGVKHPEIQLRSDGDRRQSTCVGHRF